MSYCKTPAQFVSRDCFTKEKKQPAGSGKSEDVWSSSVLEKSATVECFQEADLQREGRKTHFHNDRERFTVLSAMCEPGGVEIIYDIVNNQTLVSH